MNINPLRLPRFKLSKNKRSALYLLEDMLSGARYLQTKSDLVELKKQIELVLNEGR